MVDRGPRHLEPHWSEYTDSRRFAEEQLALAWAFQQAQTDIADTGIKAVDGIDRTGGLTPSDPTRRAARLEATDPRDIVTPDWSTGPRAHLSNVITQIAWLQSWRRGQRPRAVFDQRRQHLEQILDDLANERVAPATGLSALMP